MILRGPTWIWLDGPFPDSTLRGNAELGNINQVEVALVIYYSWLGNNRRENAVVSVSE